MPARQAAYLTLVSRMADEKIVAHILGDDLRLWLVSRLEEAYQQLAFIARDAAVRDYRAVGSAPNLLMCSRLASLPGTAREVLALRALRRFQKGRELRDRQRLAEEIALHLVAAQ
jgi:hypothetical protein